MRGLRFIEGLSPLGDRPDRAVKNSAPCERIPQGADRRETIKGYKW